MGELEAARARGGRPAVAFVGARDCDELYDPGYRGAWSASTEYGVGDVVKAAPDTRYVYLCQIACIGRDPQRCPEYWQRGAAPYEDLLLFGPPTLVRVTLGEHEFECGYSHGGPELGAGIPDPRYRGLWRAGDEYAAGDMVRAAPDLRVIWHCLAENTGREPRFHRELWRLDATRYLPARGLHVVQADGTVKFEPYDEAMLRCVRELRGPSPEHSQITEWRCEEMARVHGAKFRPEYDAQGNLTGFRRV